MVRGKRSPSGRLWRYSGCANLGPILALVFVGKAVADTPSGVVAKVGSISITAADLESRLQSMATAQRNSLGKTRQDARRFLLDRVLVPEALFSEAARVRHLEANAGVRERIDRILRAARIDELMDQLAVDDGAIERYYEEHRADFDAPARIGLWRILAPTREEAQKVLDEAKAGINAWRWKDLSREHSIDNATKWRGGELGFVAADGSSSEPAIRVDTAIVAAAEKVKDGELVADPVAEGTGYAVVWRRESMAAVHKTLAQQTEAIREILLREKLEQSARELVEALAEQMRPERHPELLSIVEVDQMGRVTPPPRPSATSHSAAVPPGPSSTPRGMR